MVVASWTRAWCTVEGQQEWIGQAPPSRHRGSLARLGWPSGSSRYGSVSTDFNRKDATAPFASSGAFGLVLHWPFFGPDQTPARTRRSRPRPRPGP